MVPNVSIIQRFHCIPYVVNMCLLLVNIHAVVKTSHPDTYCPQATAVPGSVGISSPVPPGLQTTAVPGSVDTSPPVPPGSQQNAGVSSNTIPPGTAYFVLMRQFLYNWRPNKVFYIALEIFDHYSSVLYH